MAESDKHKDHIGLLQFEKANLELAKIHNVNII